jgi:MinD-like ATPase involved in chromosome partitioning or flagellar assembly
MALANVAILLARRGKKVLAVDWDLEAPGLPRYFSTLSVTREGSGLLPLMMQAPANYGTESYRQALWQLVEPQSSSTLYLLPSGHGIDRQYTKKLEGFDWREFFRLGGGDFIENLRTAWKADYDFVLVDSRTGLTDSGGICTIQLPDIVVAMFTANFQSIDGVREIMRLAQDARQTLSFDRMSSSIIPVPARFGMRSEFKESKKWLDEFADAFAQFYDDWLPASIPPRQVLERIKIPQVDYFSFGEKLAVVEDPASNPEGLTAPYNMLADLIESNLQNIDTIIPPDSWIQTKPFDRPPNRRKRPDGYKYDVFISHARDEFTSVWVRERFLPTLKRCLTLEIPREVNIFLDFQEIRASSVWSQQITDAIIHSRVCVAIFTPRYFRSAWCLAEFVSFRSREKTQQILLPVLLAGANSVPPAAAGLQWIDLTRFALTSSAAFDSSELGFEFEVALRSLAQHLAEMINHAPPFDPKSLVISPKDLESNEGVNLQAPELSANM